MSPGALAHVLLLGTVFVWGATFVLVKAALSDASPLLFNFVRMTVATVALLVLNARHLRGLTSKHLFAGLLAGFFLACGYQFQTVGLTLTSPAKSAFITGMVVVFVPALTLFPRLRPVGTSRPGLSAGLAALLAFAGLLLITTPAGTSLRTLTGSISLGDLITLGCAISFAAHLLTLAHTAKGLPAGLLATLQVAACTVFMLMTLPLEHAHLHVTARLVIALLVCGLLATAAAFTIQTYAQQHLPPTHTVVMMALEPVFAWMTSLLFFHERLSGRSMAGAACILGGILLMELLPTVHTTEIPA